MISSPPLDKLRPLRARLIFVALGAVLLAAAYAIVNWLNAAPRPKYATAKVVRADIESSVMASGMLQPIRQVDVGARVTGQLKSLKVKLGDHVRAGDLLGEIDPVLPENELRAAQASLAGFEAQKRSAAAKLRRSKLEYERQRGMIKGEATSRRDLETAEEQLQADEANLAALEAQIAQARSRVEIAAANLAYTNITAPIEGEVVGVPTQEGQTVVAVQTAPVILKLARLDAMTVKTQVSEADVVDVKAGQRAYFTIMGKPEKRYSGVLRIVVLAPQNYSDPATSSGGGQAAGAASGANAAVFYNAIFDVPNSDRDLRIGMTAQVSIVQGTANNALAIPVRALNRQIAEGVWAVRVMRKRGEVETRRVRIGLHNHALAEVLDGLAEGDEVLTGEIAPQHGAEP